MCVSLSQIVCPLITSSQGVTLTITCFLKDLSITQHRARSRSRLVAMGGVLLLLAGCNSLPDSGPTEAQVNQAQRNPKKNTVGYGIVQISPDLITLLDSESPALFSSLDIDNTSIDHGKNDTVGPGDVLQVSVYEVGSSLFSASSVTMAASSSSGTGTLPATSSSSTLPPVVVDGEGNILVPFSGEIHVAGMTTNQVADAILTRLKQKSQSPQVVVRIVADIANSVMVYGEVRMPSRIPLTPNRERILDVIALAGGEDHTSQSDEDYTIRLIRNGRIAELPLKMIENDPAQNILMQPGDRVQVIFQPRTFSVFGATGHITQTRFTLPTLSMAEAMARLGGPLDSRADPNAVYVFRYEKADILRRLGLPIDNDASVAPVVYQLDMMNPSNYFLAQRFMMHNRDLIYVANASSNKFYKFFNLITTIVSPGMSAGGMAK
ncbi:capsule polysaccharide export protein [Komagataeibacter medellinensis NBRC 3288]|uniref:Capsule polysaccharide export protein n=2 Tax=Komagataeibacter medellinensis TaxID=1177712 RepID=G2HZZ4_KOMMN|nr:capsule polysaccharide export protein [Komagataeibacter medellinensis NBRC 3288]